MFFNSALKQRIAELEQQLKHQQALHRTELEKMQQQFQQQTEQAGWLLTRTTRQHDAGSLMTIAGYLFVGALADRYKINQHGIVA